MRLSTIYNRFVFCVLFFAVLAFCAWDGSISKPTQKDGVYQIGTPEEFAWLSDPDVRNELNRNRSSELLVRAELISDIYFADSQDEVNRKHSFRTLNRKTELRGNGYKVYGLYTESPFIVGDVYDSPVILNNMHFENFEMNVVADSMDKKIAMPVAFRHNENSVNRPDYILGDLVLKGVLKVKGTFDRGNSFVCRNTYVYGGGYENGVMVNRVSIQVEASTPDDNACEYKVIVAGVPYGYYYKDSTDVTEAENYGDISVKGDISLLEVSGIGVYGLYSGSLQKLSNYGNISVEVTEDTSEVYVAGISASKKYYTWNNRDVFVMEALNTGNISVKAKAAYYHVAGLFYEYEGYAKNFINKGNIKVEIEEARNARSAKYDVVGGCIGLYYGDSLDHAIYSSFLNEGNIDVTGPTSYCGSWSDCWVWIGGVFASATNAYNAINIGNVTANVTSSFSEHAAYVGGVAGTASDTLALSMNFGNVHAKKATSMGGVVGYADDSDVFKNANFGSVKGENSGYVSGVVGHLDGLCRMTKGVCQHEKHGVYYNANYGDVYALGKNKGAYGIIAESYATILNSFSAGKVVQQYLEKEGDSLVVTDSLTYGNPLTIAKYKNTFYDWNVFIASDSAAPNSNDVRTTKFMQSDDFVKELNFVDSSQTDLKVWKLNSKIYPYPIIAELEGQYVYAKERMPILEIPFMAVKSELKMRVADRNIVITGARVGSPYGVFNVLGRKVAQGKISSSDQWIPIEQTGRYIVRVNGNSRVVLVK